MSELSPEDLRDKKLVLCYRDGDDDAFATLVATHIDHVFAFALRLTRDTHAAEDVSQQTFVKVWQHITRFNTELRFRTWLLTIAHNCAIDYLRKKEGIPISQFDTDDGNSLLDTLTDEAALPDELFYQKELGIHLENALGNLSAHERAITLLHNTEELTFEEIGQLLGVSRNTIKSQYRRAMIKLRTILIQKELV